MQRRPGQWAGVIEDEKTAGGHLHGHKIAVEKLLLAF
jgi:hypothetical protein